jgi:hypothetical protein
MISTLWNRPATIERNNFKFKSLSCWSYNVAVGCRHKCRFCYVPQVSTIRMSGKLAEYGVKDPDAEWGDYVFPRPFDEAAFLRSLRAAEQTPLEELNRDGTVMLCTTTDPYQTVPGIGHVVRSALHIKAHAREIGATVKTDVFASPAAWADYAMTQMSEFEAIATSLGISQKTLHLWPDKSLEKKVSAKVFAEWLQPHWSKISAWPSL